MADHDITEDEVYELMLGWRHNDSYRWASPKSGYKRSAHELELIEKHLKNLAKTGVLNTRISSSGNIVEYQAKTPVEIVLHKKGGKG